METPAFFQLFFNSPLSSSISPIVFTPSAVCYDAATYYTASSNSRTSVEHHTNLLHLALWLILLYASR